VLRIEDIETEQPGGGEVAYADPADSDDCGGSHPVAVRLASGQRVATVLPSLRDDRSSRLEG
jgi:hypothetical protein